MKMESKTKKNITFSAFDEQMVRRMFGIKEELKENLLIQWEHRAKTIKITEEEQKLLDRLYAKLKLFVRSWNEEELKLKFIGHLVELVNFDDYELEVVAFSERSLGMTYNDTEINGVVDLMVASGISHPEQPFLFIHVESKSEIPTQFGKYKREKDNSGDPVGQLLSTMFVAKELNKKPKPYTLFNAERQQLTHIPLYGVYVIGRMWVFSILNEQKYFLSKSYDSTDQEDLKEIFKLLKAQKMMIMEQLRTTN